LPPAFDPALLLLLFFTRVGFAEGEVVAVILGSGVLEGTSVPFPSPLLLLVIFPGVGCFFVGFTVGILDVAMLGFDVVVGDDVGERVGAPVGSLPATGVSVEGAATTEGTAVGAAVTGALVTGDLVGSPSAMGILVGEREGAFVGCVVVGTAAGATVTGAADTGGFVSVPTGEAVGRAVEITGAIVGTS